MIEITYEPLDVESITARVRRDTDGAVVTFMGTTRNQTGSRRVLKLEYETGSLSGSEDSYRHMQEFL